LIILKNYVSTLNFELEKTSNKKTILTLKIRLTKIFTKLFMYSLIIPCKIIGFLYL